MECTTSSLACQRSIAGHGCHPLPLNATQLQDLPAVIMLFVCTSTPCGQRCLKSAALGKQWLLWSAQYAALSASDAIACWSRTTDVSIRNHFSAPPCVHKNNDPQYRAMLFRAVEAAKRGGKQPQHALWVVAQDLLCNTPRKFQRLRSSRSGCRSVLLP